MELMLKEHEEQSCIAAVSLQRCLPGVNANSCLWVMDLYSSTEANRAHSASDYVSGCRW